MAGAIGGVAPDLVFTAGIDDRVDPFVVVAEHGASRAGAFRHRDLDTAIGAGARDRYAAARCQHDALGLVGQLDAGERVERRADQARAQLVEVGDQASREGTVFA
jgi:hypothetical protein